MKNRNTLGFFFALCCSLCSTITHAEDIPNELSKAVSAIMAYAQHDETFGLTDNEINVNYSKDIFSCKIKMPLNGKDLTISTNFYRKTPTIDKKFFIDYDTAHYMFTGLLKNKNLPFANYVYTQENLQWLLYDNSVDVIAYRQHAKDKDTIELKEWIYARKPNSKKGSQYQWEYKSMGRNVVLENMPRGQVGLYQEMVINGIDAKDRKKRTQVLNTVKKAMPDYKIMDKMLTAVLEPIVYWTNDGIKKKGRYKILDNRTLNVEINESASNYPIIIDPTIMLSDAH